MTLRTNTVARKATLLNPHTHARCILCLFLTLCSSFSLWAETKASREAHRSELEIGIGDNMMNRRMMWGDPLYGGWYEVQPGMSVAEADALLRRTYCDEEKRILTPHFYLGYQYRINSWLGVGGEFDFSAETSRGSLRNFYEDWQGDYSSEQLYFTVIPQVRFTYLHREWVNLYSGLGIGATLCTYRKVGRNYVEHCLTEKRDLGASIALKLTLLGLSVGRDHWYGSAEIGCLFEPVFTPFPSRLVQASVGYRF